jgi:5-methyltetrahydrofolate--homocysteine methyltransferase
LKSAVENDADMIGLSGLITPSLDEMVTVAEEMERAQMTMPLLIGGATTSKTHTALRIEPAYSGPTVHVLDASRAVGVASTLVSDTMATKFVADTKTEYEHIRDARAGKTAKPLATLEEARANGFDIDEALKPAPPRQPGLHIYDDWDLEDLRQYIDWTPFFRAWELHGVYPGILTDEVVGESATNLFNDAQAMLDKIISEKWLRARGVAGLWPCARDGDDVVVYLSSPSLLGEGDHPQDGGGVNSTAEIPHHHSKSGPPPHSANGEEIRHIRLPFLRQQIAKREGKANMCLADFISPDGDWIGGFAVTTGHGINAKLAEFKAHIDDYSDIMLKALADRLAEAFAERMHQHVRKELWGYAPDEQLTNEALIKEQYRGIRPAPGYPACPDHSLKPVLFDLLDATHRTGITLTESFAMLPTAAVSGFYFGHPQSEYFGVARIGEDQVADYAARRGLELDKARQYLRPNLNE